MSQVGVMIPHPPSAGGRPPSMPFVQHPMSRLGDPEDLGVRGVSRGGSAASARIPMPFGRPMAEEEMARTSRTPRFTPLRHGSGQAVGASAHAALMPVPEGVQVTQGDPSKTRMPIFGNRSELRTRSGVGTPGPAKTPCRAASRISQQDRLELDEIELVLKEKVKANFFEIRKKFKDNDPEAKGNVKRDALARIIVTTLNRPLSLPQFNKLMDRVGVRDKQVISYTEFFALFREGQDTEYPGWMDPVQRQGRDDMTASQVHAQLKEQARQRVLSLADMMPALGQGGQTKVLKHEFKNVLAKLSFTLGDAEFDKLWAKYDLSGTGAAEAAVIMAQLGVSLADGGAAPVPRPPPSARTPGSTRAPLRLEAARQRSLDMERWLKDRFRQGFLSVKAEMEQFDEAGTGMMSPEDFQRVLSNMGLKLERSHLDEFLARCGVELEKGQVPYRAFITRFQDRGQGGIPHRILTDPAHRFNMDGSVAEDAQSTMSALETHLMNLFQRDFLSLLGTFHKIDQLGTDTITQEAFRAAIESRFGMEMDEATFRALIDRIPLTPDGKVKYADFMAQFDTKGETKSLFGGAQGPAVRPLSPGGVMSPPPIGPDVLAVVHEEEEGLTHPRRSAANIFPIIKDIVINRFSELEEAFYELDEFNSRRMTPEIMYQLLSKFAVEPRLTRGEIRDLWRTFITQQNGTLNFSEFVRHFGYSMRSAAFPNAKVQPPRRGDADCMMRSRKLNAAPGMLEGGLRSKVEYMWEEVRQELVGMDAFGTGFVSRDEFREVLSELCVHLSDLELDTLCQRFNTRGDGRVNYVEFLKPFALRRAPWRHGNNMLSLLQHPQAELNLADIVEPPNKGLHGVTSKLRQTLGGDWKNLRRAFKKLDKSNSGFLSVPEFRSVLQLANVVMDEDEIYHVMAQYDESMSGRIQYGRFLQETLNAPPSTAGSVRPK